MLETLRQVPFDLPYVALQVKHDDQSCETGLSPSELGNTLGNNLD